MKLTQFLLIATLVFFISSCASGTNSNLEDARFALDSSDFDAAIESATEVLEDDPDNIEASRILASAYFGRSGLDFFDLAEIILDLQDATDPNFRVVGNALPSDADMEDLRLAIQTLGALTGVDDDPIDNEALKDVVFDLAIMQAVEHFALGVYGSDFFTTTASTVDPSSIASDDASNAQDDLIDFDNRLIASGVDADNEFINQIRQTFCILEPFSAGDGFTQGEFQALVGCELSDDSAAFDTTDFSADIPNCAAVAPATQDADVEACYEVNTSL